MNLKAKIKELISRCGKGAKHHITITVHIVNRYECIAGHSWAQEQRSTIMLISSEKMVERENSFVGDPEGIVKDL